MTSQIILGNGHGIALASDSAVTFGRSRTYETSEKIYPLHFPHCIAVLHAGNVTFHGMPYRTVINEWARSLGDVPLRTLSYYVESFRKFLVDALPRWVSESELAREFILALREEFGRIRSRVDKELADPDEAGIKGIWESEVAHLNAIEDEQADIQSHRRWTDKVFGLLLPTGAYGEYWSLTELIDYVFQDLATSEDITHLIHKYVWLSINKHYPTSDNTDALLTFTGYGSEVLVPGFESLAMKGALDDAILWDKEDEQYAGRVGSGFFLMNVMGQSDAIDLFLRGYDFNLLGGTKAAVSGALYKNDSVENELGGAPVEAYENESIERAIEGTFAEFSENSYLAAFRRTIAGMPLDSLAQTARRLIDLQSLSLDLRGRLPTVGGPVRSLNITKFNGCEWVNP